MGVVTLPELHRHNGKPCFGKPKKTKDGLDLSLPTLIALRFALFLFRVLYWFSVTKNRSRACSFVFVVHASHHLVLGKKSKVRKDFQRLQYADI